MTSDTELIWRVVAGEMTVQALAAQMGLGLDEAKTLVSHFKGVRSKYNNQIVREGDLVFDSQLEHRRYHELLYLQQAGEIRALETQKPFLLQAAFRDSQGKRHRKIVYIVDFFYWEADRPVAEDTKGHPTATFRLKEKLFRARYPHIELRILYDG